VVARTAQGRLLEVGMNLLRRRDRGVPELALHVDQGQAGGMPERSIPPWITRSRRASVAESGAAAAVAPRRAKGEWR
jgi:hypothetical protein